MTERLLYLVLIVEGVVALLTVLTLLAYVAARLARSRRYSAAAGQARETLRHVVLGQEPTKAGVLALRGLPLKLSLEILYELAGAVGGASSERLREVAAATGIARRAQTWSGSTRWWRRLRALRLLGRLGDESESLLVQFLDDRHPAVRAAAAEAMGRVSDARGLALLLEMLDDSDPLCRFTARAALMRGGRQAAPAVRAYLEADDVPRSEAALVVARSCADPSFLDLALRWSAVPDPRCRGAAAALLARVGGDSATARLTALLEDPEGGVRAAGAEGLGDLGHWPAAPALLRRLEDPLWDVRSAAAAALRQLGPPGRVYLRKALGSSDPFAADIARQVLALPEITRDVVAT